MSELGERMLDEAIAHAEDGSLQTAWAMLDKAAPHVSPRVHRAANLLIFHLSGLVSNAASGRHEYVYVLRSGAFVKIGKSCNPKARMYSYGTHSPHLMELLLCIPSTAATEADLHERFKEYRTRGEWFRLEGALLEWVKAAGDQAAA